MPHPPKHDAPGSGAKLNGSKCVRTARNSSAECNDPSTPENARDLPEHARSVAEVDGARAREIAQLDARTGLKGSRLALSRIRTAEALHETIEELFDEGHDAYSRRAIAERYVGVDEKIVRSWLDTDDGEPTKPIPLAVLPLLPRAVAKRLLAKLFPEGLP